MKIKLIFLTHAKFGFDHTVFERDCHNHEGNLTSNIRARSQILVYGLTGRGLGGRSAALGVGFCGQNLGIKYIPCVGTDL